MNNAIVDALVNAAITSSQIFTRPNVISERSARVGEFTTQLRRELRHMGGPHAKDARVMLKTGAWFDVLALNTRGWDYIKCQRYRDEIHEASRRISTRNPDALEARLVRLQHENVTARELINRMEKVNTEAAEVIGGLNSLMSDMNGVTYE